MYFEPSANNTYTSANFDSRTHMFHIKYNLTITWIAKLYETFSYFNVHLILFLHLYTILINVGGINKLDVQQRVSRFLDRAPLNVIYFTTITKQVIQLILIMLVGTDVCVRMVFVWEETGVPRGNPPVWLGDQRPSHMSTSGIEPGSQRCEATALQLRQPDSL